MNVGVCCLQVRCYVWLFGCLFCACLLWLLLALCACYVDAVAMVGCLFVVAGCLVTCTLWMLCLGFSLVVSCCCGLIVVVCWLLFMVAMAFC